MNDWDLLGWAALITAVTAPVVTIILALRPLKRKVLEIDKAVNGKAPGEQSISSQVSDLHDELPPKIVEEINGAALLPLVRLLVEDMKARRDKEQEVT